VNRKLGLADDVMVVAGLYGVVPHTQLERSDLLRSRLGVELEYVGTWLRGGNIGDAVERVGQWDHGTGLVNELDEGSQPARRTRFHLNVERQPQLAVRVVSTNKRPNVPALARAPAFAPRADVTR
jgi:hypothetical protein